MFLRVLTWLNFHLYRALLVLVILGVAWLTGPVALAIALPIVAFALPVYLWSQRARARFAAFQRAFEADDAERAKEILEALRGSVDDPGYRTWFAFAETGVLFLEERYDDARAALEALSATSLSAATRVLCDNDLAWALAHTGDAALAVTKAESALERARSSWPQIVPACHGTLGVAKVLSGDAEGGRAELEHALKLGGSARMMSTRWFYLGEAHKALGDNEATIHAFVESARALPSGSFAKKARAGLEVLRSTTAYRGVASQISAI